MAGAKRQQVKACRVRVSGIEGQRGTEDGRILSLCHPDFLLDVECHPALLLLRSIEIFNTTSDIQSRGKIKGC